MSIKILFKPLPWLAPAFAGWDFFRIQAAHEFIYRTPSRPLVELETLE